MESESEGKGGEVEAAEGGVVEDVGSCEVSLDDFAEVGRCGTMMGYEGAGVRVEADESEDLGSNVRSNDDQRATIYSP